MIHIENDQDMSKWIGDTLEEMNRLCLPNFEEHCPHCGIPIRYPVVARKSDIELFRRMINTAYTVMGKHGITANLLADIRAECLIAIAKK